MACPIDVDGFFVVKGYVEISSVDNVDELKKVENLIHVDDVTNAFYLALKHKKKKFDIFNLATGKSTSINELAKIFLLSTKKHKLQPIHKKSIPGVVIQNSTNPKKIKQNLYFTPTTILRDGITKFVNNQTF